MSEGDDGTTQLIDQADVAEAQVIGVDETAVSVELSEEDIVDPTELQPDEDGE